MFRKKSNLCTKCLFLRKFLLKLTKECVFSDNQKLLKQTDGYSRVDQYLQSFSDIFMDKMEFDVAVPANLLFYKRAVNDTYVSRKKISKTS